MGFDLRAKRRDCEDWSTGAFSWSWMMMEGVGLPIGVYPGDGPCTFIFNERPDGLCTQYNDGARVSAKEAKEMAKIAHLLVAKHRAMKNIWNKLSEQEQEQRRNCKVVSYNIPVRDDFIDKMESFANWAVKSGGFRVW